MCKSPLTSKNGSVYFLDILEHSKKPALALVGQWIWSQGLEKPESEGQANVFQSEGCAGQTQAVWVMAGRSDSRFCWWQRHCLGHVYLWAASQFWRPAPTQSLPGTQESPPCGGVRDWRCWEAPGQPHQSHCGSWRRASELWQTQEGACPPALALRPNPCQPPGTTLSQPEELYLVPVPPTRPPGHCRQPGSPPCDPLPSSAPPHAF